ncbi:hypothetical protein [Thalassobellus citreus]|uniref:hypothetical protein n=1 Tax=Thalassobellus citreus TaxID=3367752 RepID=UPI003792D367
MTLSENIALIAVGISLLAFLISFLSFRREKKKSNQDLLFQEKINAYKEISFLGNKTYGDFFDIINLVQEFDGTKKEWDKKFVKFSDDYYDQAFEFQNLLSKYMVVLPNKIYKSVNDYSMNLMGFVTISGHNDSELIIDGYDRLGDHLKIVVELIRADLNVDKLNVGLSKRIK